MRVLLPTASPVLEGCIPAQRPIASVSRNSSDDAEAGASSPHPFRHLPLPVDLRGSGQWPPRWRLDAGTVARGDKSHPGKDADKGNQFEETRGHDSGLRRWRAEQEARSIQRKAWDWQQGALTSWPPSKSLQSTDEDRSVDR